MQAMTPPGWRPYPVRLRTPEFAFEGTLFAPPRVAGAAFLNQLGRYLTLEEGRVFDPEGRPRFGPERIGVERARVLYVEGLPPVPWPLSEALRERRRVAFFYADFRLEGGLDLRRGTELSAYLARTREFVDLFDVRVYTLEGERRAAHAHLVLNLDATLGVIEVEAGDFGAGF